MERQTQINIWYFILAFLAVMWLRDALTEMEYFQGDYYVGVHREGDRWVVTFAATPEG